MKQLLIVNSAKALNATGATPNDLSKLDTGAITFFELGESTPLSAAPKKNFGIALGRPNNSPVFLIPEVDLNTLTVNVADPTDAVKFKAEFTVPTPVAGQTYTAVLVKKGTVPHERNTWTATETVPAGTTMTAAKLAEKLAGYFNAAGADGTGAINIKATVSSAKVTIDATVDGEQWALKLGDALFGTVVTTTEAKAAFGDKAYIQNLASECAAGKGFTDVYQDGASIYPGYPEEVEDTKYAVFTLRFAVPRVASKTRDEVVNQIVHIAVPKSATSYATIKAILTQPVLVNEKQA